MTKTPEEKPYLQDLFDHMRNEHNLILTRSEMQEIISVVQQSLTTESVVKENLTSEQRAREYAERSLKLCEHTINKQSYRINYFNADDIEQAYLYGSSQLTAYREALREIVKQVPRCNFNLSTSTSYSEANRLDELIVKAKQLIEEGENEEED